jgi:serine/threonine protein kinase
MLKPDECFHEHYQISYSAAEQPECSVYRAYDQRSARPVLIAELPQEDEEALAATRLLAQEVAALYEASLLTIREHFAAEHVYYMIVDDPGGHDLERAIQYEAGNPPDQRHLLGLAMLDQAGRLLNALEALHNHKPPLLVGELHPGDVWSSAEGALYLAPFALLRPVQAGTVAYRAPELETAAGEATPASDLYALGAVCYHLLTGWPPPTAALRLAGTPLNTPRSLNADIPPLLDQVIIRALDVQPANRYQTVYEMRHALALARMPAPPAATSENSQPAASVPAAGAGAAEMPAQPLPAPTYAPQTQPAQASSSASKEAENNTCLLVALLVLAVLALSICAVGILFLLGPGRTLLNLDGPPLRGTQIALQYLLGGGM